jgi:UDP-N-acetylglucosamine--N-acetylmuramyl-(pentapeptide) pyrophosphoryl-undecaprenol N-acetylglucosamine transferase
MSAPVRAAKPPFFVASPGGHLDLLTALAGQALDGEEPVWVTARTAGGRAMRRERRRVILLPDIERRPLWAVPNALAALWVVLRDRPRVVVSSGAGLTVPFCVLARIAGARLVFVETMARVSAPSMSARLLAPLADAVIVQWRELTRALPKATVCRPVLLERIRTGPPPPGAGTFVAVGTHPVPYRRLLDMVAAAAAGGVLPAPVVAQTGAADWRAPGVETIPWLPRAELERRVAAAQVVVCHGGAGIVSSALAAGRRPLVLPREAARGEHFDDHQRELVAKLADWRLLVQLRDTIGRDDVAAAGAPLGVPEELSAAASAAEMLRAALARQ